MKKEPVLNNWELRDGDLFFMCKASLILRMKSLEEESIILKLERGEEEQQELQDRIWRKIEEEDFCQHVLKFVYQDGV